MRERVARTSRGGFRIPLTWHGRETITQVLRSGSSLEMRNVDTPKLWPGDDATGVEVWARRQVA